MWSWSSLVHTCQQTLKWKLFGKEDGMFMYRHNRLLEDNHSPSHLEIVCPAPYQWQSHCRHRQHTPPLRQNTVSSMVRISKITIPQSANSYRPHGCNLPCSLSSHKVVCLVKNYRNRMRQKSNILDLSKVESWLCHPCSINPDLVCICHV